MKKIVTYIGIATSLFVAQSAFAEQKFCMIKSTSQYGNTKTCLENVSLPEEAFKQICQPASDNVATVESEFLSNGCPTPYKGVCKNLKMEDGSPFPFLSYVYGDAMEFMVSGCKDGGGTWSKG